MLNLVLLVNLKLKVAFVANQWNEKHCHGETRRMSWKCSAIRHIIQLASHHGGVGSIPAQVIWDLWWEKWHWCRFSQSSLVSLANSYSTNCYILINHHIDAIQCRYRRRR
jgi:hypothetical protein